MGKFLKQNLSSKKRLMQLIGGGKKVRQKKLERKNFVSCKYIYCSSSSRYCEKLPRDNETPFLSSLS